MDLGSVIKLMIFGYPAIGLLTLVVFVAGGNFLDWLSARKETKKFNYRGWLNSTRRDLNDLNPGEPILFILGWPLIWFLGLMIFAAIVLSLLILLISDRLGKS